jgi:hypothetical protein
MTRPVADQMVETLAAPGIEHIYGIVGDSLNSFIDAQRRQGGFELSALIEALVQHAVDTPETKLTWDRLSSIFWTPTNVTDRWSRGRKFYTAVQTFHTAAQTTVLRW